MISALTSGDADLFEEQALISIATVKRYRTGRRMGMPVICPVKPRIVHKQRRPR